MRSLALGIVAGVGLAAGSLPAFAQSYTTRIEPRPAYGAIATMEKSVRVFRPLPPHDRVIINPNGTPVQLNIGDAPYGRPYLDGYRR